MIEPIAEAYGTPSIRLISMSVEGDCDLFNTVPLVIGTPPFLEFSILKRVIILSTYVL
ncbi:hypothetical protein Hanom_Chr11g01029181 [Helianthus anomalus]